MEYAGIALVPIVMGLTELAKRFGCKRKYCPLLSLFLGLFLGVLLLGAEDLRAGIIQGVYIGLSSSGLYSGVKNTAEKISNNDDT